MENLPNIFKDSMRKAELQAHNYMITDILSLLVEINDIVNQKNKIECNEQNQELTIVSNYIKQMQLLKDHVDKYDRKTFRTLSNYIFNQEHITIQFKRREILSRFKEFHESNTPLQRVTLILSGITGCPYGDLLKFHYDESCYYELNAI